VRGGDLGVARTMAMAATSSSRCGVSTAMGGRLVSGVTLKQEGGEGKSCGHRKGGGSRGCRRAQKVSAHLVEKRDPPIYQKTLSTLHMSWKDRKWVSSSQAFWDHSPRGERWLVMIAGVRSNLEEGSSRAFGLMKMC
jgi:hypothetical protein